MVVTGLYRIALLPGADEQAFVRHLTDVGFGNANLFHTTRITRGFQHRLLKVDDRFRQFLWLVQVDLMTDAGYHFAEDLARVQEAVAGFGVVIALESGEHVAEG